MLDMCDYFFSNFKKSHKDSMAKVKIAQNCHVCEYSKESCMLYSVKML